MPLTLSNTSMPSACSEHQLVTATRSGDDRAFEELYSRYQGRIFSFILSKVHDHARAEDIAQDVFMSALRRLRHSDQPITFKPWIYEIAKNACIDEFRRGNRSREVPLQTDGEFVTDGQATLSPVSTPAVAIESKQRMEDLRGAFGGLASNHHQLLVMREFEGRSYDEIGERLEMTRQMVESGLFRARRKLTEEYQELASGRRCQQVQSAIEAGAMRSVSSLGLRDRRRFARHLAHCQACRHAALMAGVDEALVKPRSIAAKIAALLPFPVWRWIRPRPPRGGATATGSHHVAGTLQNAADLTQPVASSVALGPAAAAIAALAIAGGGGGLAHVLSESGHRHRPALATRSFHQRARRSQQPTAGTSAGTGAATSRAAAARTATSPSRARSPLRVTGQRPATTRHTRPTLTTPGWGSGAPGAPARGAARGSVPPAAATTAHGPSLPGVPGKATGPTGAVNSATSSAAHTVTGSAPALSHTVHAVAGTLGKAVSDLGSTVSNVASTVSNVAQTVTSSPPVSAVQSAAAGAVGAVKQTASTVATAAGDAVSGAGGTTGSSSLSPVTKLVGSALSQVGSGLGAK